VAGFGTALADARLPNRLVEDRGSRSPHLGDARRQLIAIRCQVLPEPILTGMLGPPADPPSVALSRAAKFGVAYLHLLAELGGKDAAVEGLLSEDRAARVVSGEPAERCFLRCHTSPTATTGSSPGIGIHSGRKSPSTP
jgi:hypothetical protein